MNLERAILSGNNLHKRYFLQQSATSPKGILTALDGVTLEISAGETIGIAGESGCGKSTLGKILSGLIKPDNGEVRFHGAALSELSPESFNIFRRQTQMIFQDPFSSLNPRMRIGDAIAEPLALSGKVGSSSLRPAVEELMTKVGLTPEQYNRFPHEFSGGQRQRIGIARALAASPSIIIADEPVSSLDISIQAQILNLLRNMKFEYQLSLVIISHDLSVLRYLCDRVNIMYLGIIVESAPTAELFRHCLHPYTEALIAAIPRIDEGKTHSKPILKDDLPSPMSIPAGCRFHTRCRHAGDICRSEVPPLEEKQNCHFAACHFSNRIFPY